MLKSFNNIDPSDDYKLFMQALKDGKHLDMNIIPLHTGVVTPVNEMGVELKKFIKVSYDGTYYIATIEEVEGIIAECDDSFKGF